MKKHIFAIAAAALFTIPTISFAEDQPAGEKPRHERREGGRAHHSPEERLKFMTEKLGLTADQQEKIKAIFAKNEAKFKAAHEKGRKNLTEEERKDLRATHRAQEEEINAVLTPEQKAKRKELMEEHRGNRKHNGPGKGKRGGEPKKSA